MAGHKMWWLKAKRMVINARSWQRSTIICMCVAFVLSFLTTALYVQGLNKRLAHYHALSNEVQRRLMLQQHVINQSKAALALPAPQERAYSPRQRSKLTSKILMEYTDNGDKQRSLTQRQTQSQVHNNAPVNAQLKHKKPMHINFHRPNATQRTEQYFTVQVNAPPSQQMADCSQVHDNSTSVSCDTTQPKCLNEKMHLSVSIDARGRVGNQLFQYASLYSIARHNYRTPLLPHQFVIWDIFSNINATRLVDERDFSEECYLNEGDQHYATYTSKVLKVPKVNFTLDGFFQSWKYFQTYEEELRQQFTFKPHILRKALQFFNKSCANTTMALPKKLAQQNPQLYNHVLPGNEKEKTYNFSTIGIHIRRNDMLADGCIKSGYRVASSQYLQRAILYFRKRYKHIHFVVCTDDLPWAKTHLRGTDVSFSDDHHYSVDLAILSMCDHVIMTVGTFGWWAGWLAGGEVLYCDNPVAAGSNKSHGFTAADFFPPHWRALKCN